jgi:transcription-repair coupling factor (superfamily II helicase)
MLQNHLASIGYFRVTTVTQPGHFAQRGGILDVFPIGASLPVRIEMFGDAVESIRRFDPATQRSTGSIPCVEVLPARAFVLTRERANHAVPRVREILAARCNELIAAGRRAEAEELEDRIGTDLAWLREREYFDAIEDYIPYIVPEDVCAFDYLKAGKAAQAGRPPIVVLDDAELLETHWQRVLTERAEARERRKTRGDMLEGAEWQGVSPAGLSRVTEADDVLELSPIERNRCRYADAAPVVLHSAAMESFHVRVEFLAEETARWLEQGALCVVVTDQPQRTREVLAELEIPLSDRPDSSGMVICEGRLRQGFKLDEAKLYVLTDAELFGSTRPTPTRKRAAGGIPISTLLDLREGDYVVHVVHGIGIYRGMVKRLVDGAEKDYLAIQYAGTDRLYVPADQIDRVQRYIGAEGAKPTVNRIGGADWQRTTRRVKEQARELARELIDLYAARETAQRPPFGEDSPWQTEMEEAFPFEPTRGQAQAIADVKADLAAEKPADRLICGDVGFGKTEVAVRAAFKVVEAGKQVAILCPTTVLAAQHHTTFTERMAAYPIRIELLSRFRSREEQKRTITNLRTGATDIVVGTHRLLSRDVEFARLGLLIIDEEQRFGVAQKEKLKQLRKSVDVLTLTATPIPRTLSMALSGLREMSVIEDPPEGRLPIVTSVQEYSDELVRDAIMRELAREGQVYLVHNRVETIGSFAQRIQRLVPDARLAIAHGQMSEDELERVMHGFYNRDYDVLVCTTIIENGLDVPNVNTIIVDSAEHMGLAQLYQLRGRVGRSSRQAYAYLLVKPGRMLSEDAQNRLMAVKEFTALGSGYQIALRDLEIRGAGNLLGSQQSGAMSAVGFDMYCRLLAQAVAEARGDEVEEQTLPPADLPVTAHIPAAYIPNEAERIYFYKRMSGVSSIKDIGDVQDELHDRYGDPPKPVWNALEVLRVRLAARQIGLAAIRYENKAITLRFGSGVHFTPQGLAFLATVYRDYRLAADAVIIPLKSAEVLREVERMVKAVARALQHGGKQVARRGGKTQ